MFHARAEPEFPLQKAIIRRVPENPSRKMSPPHPSSVTIEAYFFSPPFMKSVNKVILIGNVTRDPELKTTATGQTVCTFGLATNRFWKDQTGAKQSLAEFHNLVAWGGLGTFCAENIRKGKPIYIEGYLKTRSWEGQEGVKIFRTEVVIGDLVLLGTRDQSPADGISHEAEIDETEQVGSDMVAA